ncbi:hypothetical protein [uncultured Vibrio sp.]|uniref:hypothetical protein n=1 Tax=uncultured Vibrio sp. TaxID=114054 RepID=UPI0025F4F482|nr:hypothetical protein [uncultured Vibrio sp.]
MKSTLMKPMLTMLFVSLSLTGCVDHIVEPRGTEIEVIPVTYQLQLHSDKQELAAEKVRDFIADYPQNVKTAHWAITTKGKQGEVLYQEVFNQLTKAGVTQSQIDHNQNALPSSSRFDLSVSVTVLKVKLEICHQEQVGEYGKGSLGCTVDTSRWHSMVNPHKAI